MGKRGSTDLARSRFSDDVVERIFPRQRDQPTISSTNFANSSTTGCITPPKKWSPDTTTLDAFVQGLREQLGVEIRVLDYSEHAKGAGVDAAAVAYIEMRIDGAELWGCGIHTDITTSSMRALVSALNRSRRAS